MFNTTFQKHPQQYYMNMFMYCQVQALPTLSVSHYLFLCESDAGEEVDCFLIAKVKVIAQQENEHQFAHIFLLLVPVQLVT